MKPKNPLYPSLKIPTEQGDLTIPVVNQETLDKAAKEEGLVVCCMPAEDDVIRVPGSTKEKCSFCGKDVWMSPATKQSKPPEAHVACIFCVTKEIEKEKREQQGE